MSSGVHAPNEPKTVYFTVTRFEETLLESINDLNQKTCVNHLGHWNVPMYTKKGYTQVKRRYYQATGNCSGVTGSYTELWYTWAEGCIGEDKFRAKYKGNGKQTFRMVITCSGSAGGLKS